MYMRGNIYAGTVSILVKLYSSITIELTTPGAYVTNAKKLLT